MVFFAGMPSLWSLFWVVFIVIPAVRWSVGWSTSRRRWWIANGLYWDGDRSTGRRRGEIAELRAELEGRLADIESLNQRVAELENRVDFTERLMAQPRDPVLASPPPSNG
jgi:hypothetical protein